MDDSDCNGVTDLTVFQHSPFVENLSAMLRL